ncbi:hypothetical protein OGAPHI_004127 [Ogataea philodendri]|uniref:Protein MSS2, mitochondrial n=1 Tax=Ogataea philodendri TaxID=1378263 RepID=A0A9P8P5L8_9ASCO|nr:uncharacterized protein OGAPHI_004127 [Ogataea philodendri]KAH3665938.1 hypothetical protein OGAPHI_004127 [Ogataea philodendri]
MFIRKYSTPRPLLLDILPQRKLIKRLLFDFDAKFNYGKYLPVVQKVYDNVGKDQLEFPKKFRGRDLLLFQKVLNEIRQQTHTSNKYLVELEEELVERAAELGSRDALTILSFKALRDTNNEYTQDDKVQAEKFVAELKKLEHPLVYKMNGDYQFDLGNFKEAVGEYWKFIQLDKSSFLAADAFKALGMIHFKQRQLLRAKLFFEKSIKLAPVSKVAQSHFMLGQIYEIDPVRARYHFEMAATQGFRESFQMLGFLELNYFNNIYKAKTWFRMGSELSDYNCMIGLFDCYIKEQNWKAARKAFDGITKYLDSQQIQLDLESIRKESVDKLISHETTSSVSKEPSSIWDV